MNKKRQKFIFLIGIVFYYFSLHFVYHKYLLTQWGYVGYFDKVDLSIYNYIYDLSIIIIPFILYKK